MRLEPLMDPSIIGVGAGSCQVVPEFILSEAEGPASPPPEKDQKVRFATLSFGEGLGVRPSCGLSGYGTYAASVDRNGEPAIWSWFRSNPTTAGSHEVDPTARVNARRHSDLLIISFSDRRSFHHQLSTRKPGAAVGDMDVVEAGREVR